MPGTSSSKNSRMLRELISQLKAGLPEDKAASLLEKLLIEDLGHARIDRDRERRTGFPEVIYGEGKEPEQLEAICRHILEEGKPLLVTRVASESAKRLCASFETLTHHPRARCLVHDGDADSRRRLAMKKGRVLVVCAGTTDLPVAEEALITVKLMGCRADVLRDVGVAGLHRLLGKLDALRKATVIIAVAGMEGALPSVIGGLVKTPVIAVPTSVGYGANLGGLTPLLAMLNTCAPGVTVVNVDNGFGAGYAAARIIRSLNGK